MFVTIHQERLDARQEYQQGEEQSRLREQLRTDYELQDFLIDDFESGDYTFAITEMIETIKNRLNAMQTKIDSCEQRIRTEPLSNYYAIRAEERELIKELARMVCETIEDFGGGKVYEQVKRRAVENAINKESNLFKQARR